MKLISTHLMLNRLGDEPSDCSDKSVIYAFRDLWRVWNKDEFSKWWPSYSDSIAYEKSFEPFLDGRAENSVLDFNSITDEQFIELVKLAEKYEKLMAFR